jgi:hypothetical protein
MLHVLHNNRRAAVIAGGVFMSLAALLMHRWDDPGEKKVEGSHFEGEKEVAA